MSNSRYDTSLSNKDIEFSLLLARYEEVNGVGDKVGLYTPKPSVGGVALVAAQYMASRLSYKTKNGKVIE